MKPIFKDKEERNDFWIAMGVILFFLLMFWRLIGNDEVTPTLPVDTDVLTTEVITTIGDLDNDGIADDIDECPEMAGLESNNGCPTDRDGDGIADIDDKCPRYRGSASNKGCPADTDGDGLHDGIDKCPEIVGTLELDGCAVAMIDTDNDGIADENDKCPSIAGTQANNGCPADTDGDGIIDTEDKCPKYKGTVANAGCPADTDRDGVHDGIDKCPREKGTLQNNGCEADSDGDGIKDSKDRCPKKAGIAANNGCPEVKIEKEDKAVLENAMKSVEFDSGRATLKGNSTRTLDKIAGVLKKYPDYKLAIEGHTDNTSSAATNLRLSKERAKACYDYLVTRGIASNKMAHRGYGESRPKFDNNSNEGQRKNRRVEFSLNY